MRSEVVVEVAWGINVGMVRKDPETASLFAYKMDESLS